MRTRFEKRLQSLELSHRELVHKSNKKLESSNGVYNHYTHPVLTAAHTPVSWRYDLNYETNPHLMERYGINAILNAGAIILHGKYLLIAGLEGNDGRSFFAVAESSNGIDNLEFWDYPVVISGFTEAVASISEMKLVQHEDGWIYSIFRTGASSSGSRQNDEDTALTTCGIARTSDLKNWERLPDLITPLSERFDIVLHPGFMEGKYAFYINLKDWNDGARGWGIGLTESLTNADIKQDILIDEKQYDPGHEFKNPVGPAPIKTSYGWLHLAYEQRNTAAGIRSVLYLFMTELKNITRIIYRPAVYFLTPEGSERMTNQSFDICNSKGWVCNSDGTIYIYYVCADCSLHVVTTTTDQLLDYVMNTAPGGMNNAIPANTLFRIIDNNRALMQLKPALKEKSLR